MNRPVRVVLVQPRNPLNIGACARALANFGLSDLVVVDPFEPVWQEVRSAPGAEHIVLEARVAQTWVEAVGDCSIVLGTSSFHQRPLEQALVELPNLNRFLTGYPASSPLALVFGSERSGLGNSELARCHAVIHIPTAQRTPSMNLAQAVAVVLYELRRAGWDPEPEPVAARAVDFEALLNGVSALGQVVDYPPGYTESARLGRVRQAFQPAVLPPATVRFLLSFVRHLRKLIERQNNVD